MKHLFFSLIKKGFFHLLTVNFLTQFLSFGSILIVAKFLTPKEIGDIRIIQSYGNVFLVLATFGLNTAILKFCSENRSIEYKKALLRHSIILSFLFSFLTIMLILVFSYSGLMTSSSYLAFWIIIYAFSIPILSVTNILTCFLQAIKEIKKMANAQMIVKLQSVFLIIVSTWLWGFKGFILATIISYMLGLLPYIKQIGFNFIFFKESSRPLGFFKVALFSMLANGISLIGQYADIFILDRFYFQRDEIGYYSLAVTFFLAAQQVTATVQTISTPYFSEGSNNKIWFKKKLFQTQARMFSLSVLVAVGIYLISFFLIPLFYGNEYHHTLSYLKILLIKYIIWSMYAIVGAAIVGLGLMRLNFMVVLITTPIGIFLTYYFLVRYGVFGVAWVQVINATLSLILTYLFGYFGIKRKFSIGNR